MSRRKIAALRPIVFLSTTFANAQSQTTWRIAGVVRDGREAVVPGATIEVINKATGEERQGTRGNDQASIKLRPAKA